MVYKSVYFKGIKKAWKKSDISTNTLTCCTVSQTDWSLPDQYINRRQSAVKEEFQPIWYHTMQYRQRHHQVTMSNCFDLYQHTSTCDLTQLVKYQSIYQYFKKLPIHKFLRHNSNVMYHKMKNKYNLMLYRSPILKINMILNWIIG